MVLSEAVRKRIIDLAAQRGVTIHKLSLMAGVPYSTLNSFMVKKSNSITLTTLLHICEGANITIKQFFNDDVFKNVSSDKKEEIKEH